MQVHAEDDQSDVNKLHEGDLLELWDCLVVDGVPFLNRGYILKDHATDDVNEYDDKGGGHAKEFLPNS